MATYRPPSIATQAESDLLPCGVQEQRLDLMEAIHTRGYTASPYDGTVRTANRSQCIYEMPSIVRGHMSPNTRHDDDIGRGNMFVCLEQGRIGVYKANVALQSGLESTPRAGRRGVAIQLNQIRANFGSSFMQSKNINYVSTVAGTNAD